MATALNNVADTVYELLTAADCLVQNLSSYNVRIIFELGTGASTFQQSGYKIVSSRQWTNNTGSDAWTTEITFSGPGAASAAAMSPAAVPRVRSLAGQSGCCPATLRGRDQPSSRRHRRLP